MSDLKILDPGEYTVGWICALGAEYVAAQVLLDEKHNQPETRARNDGIYKLGAIHNHNVVITVLPKGECGIASAATVATNTLRTFPNIRIGLMVGIGGGVPSQHHDIRLGDIVVSVPEDGQSGVFQYDYGKSIQEEAFRYTRALSQPPQALLTAVSALEAEHIIEGNGLFEAVEGVLAANPRLKNKGFKKPSPDSDILFKSDFVHYASPCVSTCGIHRAKRVRREERTDEDPEIHYGTIASANTLMKDARKRDLLAAEKKILCFEMEAAALMNRFPCLVIRGICDYSDSHKSNEWQGYAAMVAAAYAKSLLYTLTPESALSGRTLQSILDDD
ncbi:hypothetical protein ACHAPT_009395 [Fusarium lateritium]